MSGTASYVKSPLNYVGGKYRILDQLLPLFPKKIDTFIDLFGGGFNVGANVESARTVYNDVLTPLYDLMRYFYGHSADEVVTKLESNIRGHGLSKTDKQAYLALRDRYNADGYLSGEEKILDFYSLVLYSFNYQIRFNLDMKYNTPFGADRSSYNANTKKNLAAFINRIRRMSISFSNNRFDETDFSRLGSGDLVYCDPPYLVTTGSYNDGNRGGVGSWTEREEQGLLDLLDRLDGNGAKFALSNALSANGKENALLSRWAEKYDIHYIDNSFNNSNYKRQSRDDLKEVLITNYGG